ncbi:MAG: acyltransferase [Promethearchaeota archaeon]|nr:MAG: acyltransferase [Candidatus Lokiarchaeota archaeon]
MKVGYIQTSPVFGNKEENFSQIEGLTKGIKADLIVLPELFATGYNFQSKKEANDLAEDTNGDTAEFLKNLSIKTGAIVVGGFAEKDGDHLFNSALVVYQNYFKGRYRKVHLYYKEKLWFAPGNKGFEIFTIQNLRLGVMICFDWIFPESARSLALSGAQIIAHPANLVLPYCQNAMVTRCLENRVFAITANRTGTEKRGEDDFSFTGQSQITSQKGEILSSAPKDQPYVDILEIDENLADNKDLNEYNNLFKDRRSDCYKI